MTGRSLTCLLAGLSIALLSAPSARASKPICVTCDSTRTIQTQFPPPDGLTRIDVPPGSFSGWLRDLTLAPGDTPSRSWRGRVAMEADEVAAVFDWRLLGRVEQCADIALRLVAEYARTNGERKRIAFRSLSGQTIAYRKWLTGQYSINHNATAITYESGAGRADTQETFDSYLRFVMAYANTVSMARDWTPVAPDDIQIGDVMIQPYSPRSGVGHLSIVVDACEDTGGSRLYLFADGYTPARVPVIRAPQGSDGASAWMTTTEYQHHMRQFGPGTFYRFPGWPAQTGSDRMPTTSAR